ncbi:hypothetical protein HD554DRAFT_142784 [Boletus coccyginus]|nr:hypothetical protein HD554DRAFT_142784 [Boletus coccyginus]
MPPLSLLDLLGCLSHISCLPQPSVSLYMQYCLWVQSHHDVSALLLLYFIPCMSKKNIEDTLFIFHSFVNKSMPMLLDPYKGV